MKNRNLLSIKKLAVLGICVSFVAGGCGKMTESSIPKLEEPVALNEAYRPVEYGTIGSMHVLMATAVPRDYCNYYGANVNISQIYVEPGHRPRPVSCCNARDNDAKFTVTFNQLPGPCRFIYHNRHAWRFKLHRH